MITYYVYHKDNKIKHIKTTKTGPEDLEVKEFTFEEKPTAQEIEQKFYEIKEE
jgi:hypothetical protein